MTNFPIVGGEDSEFQLTGATVITTAGRFRATLGGANIARCALKCANGSQIIQLQDNNGSPNLMSVTDIWIHAEVRMASNAGAQWHTSLSTTSPIKIVDSSVLTRLAIAPNTPAQSAYSNTLASNFSLYKVNAAGTYTALEFFSAWLSGSPATPDQIDIQIISYGASGTVNVWINQVLACTYTGDIHTDSNTALNGLSLSGMENSVQSSGEWTEFDWTEVIINDTDTRSMVLATRPPVANGTTHTFDTGTPAASNVNEIIRDDTTFDGSSVAGQIDGYTIDTTLPAGYGIYAVVGSALLQAGSSGPSKMDIGVGISGTYYWSADITPGLSMQPNQNPWKLSPATSASWVALPNNVALKSVT